jgi:hypothetical protein
MHSQPAILKRAVVLNLTNRLQTNKQIIVTDSGEVLLYDGPIAKLEESEIEFCRQNHLVPVRLIAEALGYTVEWEPNQTVRITKQEFSLVFNINDEFYQFNDKFVRSTDKPFVIFNNRAFSDYSVINALVN